ncbi:MAG TPA: hypothetical protein VG406_02940, partial [Isosphaeraceae bacterium]|nr:hypothetical protein [Isosphaeraceae bacterium]
TADSSWAPADGGVTNSFVMRFQTEAVPEPTSLGRAAAGRGLVAAARRRRRGRVARPVPGGRGSPRLFDHDHGEAGRAPPHEGVRHPT